MKATIKIENRTRYRSDHLRAFVVRARDQVFGDDRKPLRVVFRPARCRVHGRASLGGSWSTIWVPQHRLLRSGWGDLRLELAQILIHELAHNAGANGELWMRRSTRFGWGQGWQDNVRWAETLPLELAQEPVKEKASSPAVLEAKRARVEARIQKWQSKEKRAKTALRKLRRSLSYYDRRLAASRGGGV